MIPIPPCFWLFSVLWSLCIFLSDRVLCGFQSRKAHRVHVRDKDILKFLGLFIITAFTYMVAWTAVNLDYMSSTPWSRNPEGSVPISMVIQGSLIDDSQTNSAGFVTREFNGSGLSNGSILVPSRIPEIASSVTTFDVCRSLSWDVIIGLCKCACLQIFRTNVSDVLDDENHHPNYYRFYW